MNSVETIVHKYLINEVRVKSSERVKLYEDDEWLVVQPLSFEASCKYGHGSSWCTSTPSQDNNFNQYNNDGILIYYINKKTDDKYAQFIDFTGNVEVYDKLDNIIPKLPTTIKKVFNLTKSKIKELLLNKNIEKRDKFLKSPSVEWLNGIWESSEVFTTFRYPKSLFYGTSKDSIYLEKDEVNNIIWFNNSIMNRLYKDNPGWDYKMCIQFLNLWVYNNLELEGYTINTETIGYFKNVII